MRVLVCGSRSWSDAGVIAAYLRGLPRDAIIVTGGAAGADHHAARLAHELGLAVELHVADWPRYGRSAGMRRNAAMVAVADCVMAFWDGVSPGTLQTVKLAKRKGLPTRVVVQRTEAA